MRLALLDLYDGEKNLGIAAIEEILDRYQGQFEWKRFDVRQDSEVPVVEDYDLFISSGGPGSPLDGDGVWDRKWHAWLDDLWSYNLRGKGRKKYAFFICHSFQMLCHHFELGEITKRDVTSFGTFPVDLTEAASEDPVFQQLSNPFYAADFRDYQVVEPDMERFEALGAQIMAMENIPSGQAGNRALMALRLSEEISAVQFHPEAHVKGMLKHFQDTTRMVQVVNQYGKKKYAQMIKDLSDPAKIQFTYEVVIPAFIERSLESLKEQVLLA